MKKQFIPDPHTKTAVRMLSNADLDALIDQNSKWADEAEEELDRREMDKHDPHLNSESAYA